MKDESKFIFYWILDFNLLRCENSSETMQKTFD